MKTGLNLEHFKRKPLYIAVLGGALALSACSYAGAGTNPCNPCAAKVAKANPCNPCAAKKMNPCNPCAAKKMNPCNPCNPCAAKKNPCNPCAAKMQLDVNLITRPKGTRLATGNRAAMIAYGKTLWNDKGLSGNGSFSCNLCHNGNKLFKASFRKAYPHPVQMTTQMAGKKSIDLDEMIQACMLIPMNNKPLAWSGKKLAALTAYTAQVQKSFMMAATNPCNPCNPCAAKKMNPCNPCNPCAAKKMNPCNPCAAKKMNPCNPCAAKKKNPCNPCAAS